MFLAKRPKRTENVDDSTIWVWIAQRVIEVQSEEFKSKMAGLSFLKEMIALELD